MHGPVGVNWRYDKTWCVEGTGSSIWREASGGHGGGV